MSTKTFLSESGVIVTKERVVFNGDTYALANVASCKSRWFWATDSFKSFLKKLCLWSGILIGLYFFIFSHAKPVGFIFIVAGIVGYFVIKDKYKIYKVILGASSGEVDAYKSPDGTFINRVTKAINDAIIERG